MPNVTRLSSGSLNDQTLKIEFVESGNDLPNAVMIRWRTDRLHASARDHVVANAMKVLSNAVLELAAIRVWKKL